MASEERKDKMALTKLKGMERPGTHDRKLAMSISVLATESTYFGPSTVIGVSY
jgi:hypothetical protein